MCVATSHLHEEDEEGEPPEYRRSTVNGLRDKRPDRYGTAPGSSKSPPGDKAHEMSYAEQY